MFLGGPGSAFQEFTGGRRAGTEGWAAAGLGHKAWAADLLQPDLDVS